MDTLNKDCLCSIAYHLNFSDTYNFSKTCRKIMKQVYNNKYFWISKIGNTYENELFLESSKQLDVLKSLKKTYYYSQYNRKYAFSRGVLNGDVDFVSKFYDEKEKGLIRMGLYNASMVGNLNVVQYLSTDILPEEKALLKMCIEAAIRNKHSDIVNFYIRKFKIQKDYNWILRATEFLCLFIILIYNILL